MFLQAICSRMIVDEQPHLDFHAFILNYLRSSCWDITRAYLDRQQEWLLLGVVNTVWRRHAPVLATGGNSRTEFRDKCFAALHKFQRTIQEPRLPPSEVDREVALFS